MANKLSLYVANVSSAQISLLNELMLNTLADTHPADHGPVYNSLYPGICTQCNHIVSENEIFRHAVRSFLSDNAKQINNSKLKDHQYLEWGHLFFKDEISTYQNSMILRIDNSLSMGFSIVNATVQDVERYIRILDDFLQERAVDVDIVNFSTLDTLDDLFVSQYVKRMRLKYQKMLDDMCDQNSMMYSNSWFFDPRVVEFNKVVR